MLLSFIPQANVSISAELEPDSEEIGPENVAPGLCLVDCGSGPYIKGATERIAGDTQDLLALSERRFYERISLSALGGDIATTKAAIRNFLTQGYRGRITVELDPGERYLASIVLLIGQKAGQCPLGEGIRFVSSITGPSQLSLLDPKVLTFLADFQKLGRELAGLSECPEEILATLQAAG